MKISNYCASLALLAASATTLVSCGPSAKTFQGTDFTVSAPSSLEVAGTGWSKRHAVSSTLDLEDPERGDVYNIEVIYAELNPAYLLEDYYGEEPEEVKDGMYVTCPDSGNIYAFNEDGYTFVVMIPGESTITIDDFTDWTVSHDAEDAARRCDHNPEGDRPFLYETYGTFSPNIDYAITDDNITMRRFEYNPETNNVDVTILLRSKSRDGYMTHKDSNDEYVVSRVKDFAASTGLYYTYCRSKGADLEITIVSADGETLPVITAELK